MFRPHLGVAYIQAHLARHKISAKQVMPEIGSTLVDCVERLLATDANVLGFTCYDSNYHLVHTISKHIKIRNPEKVIVAGGPTATFSDELLMSNSPDVDLCVRFEGEETALQLASRMKDGGLEDGLEEIAGITYRKNGEIIRNPDRDLFGLKDEREYSLDGLDSPYLEGIFKGTEGAGILTSRGCPQHCIFCNFSAMSKHTVRYHSPDRVIAELKCIESAMKSSPPKYLAARRVEIQDDNFAANPRRAKEICRRIISEGIDLPLSCDFIGRPENIDDELMQLLSRAGFSKLFFGLESAVPRVLRNIKRVRNISRSIAKGNYQPEINYLEKVREAVILAKRYKMETSIGIILGLPGETLEDGYATVNFVRELNVDSYSHNYLGIFAGTELFKNTKRYGLGISPSDTIQPYDVRYAYPVQEIPFGKNSTQQGDMDAQARHILRAFAGGPIVRYGNESGIKFVIMERPEKGDFKDIFDQLSTYLAVGGRIIILGEENDSMRNHNAATIARYECGLPARSCCYLKSTGNIDSEVVYEIMNKPFEGKLLQWDSRFHLIDIREHINFRKKYNNTNDWPIYCLKKREDILYLFAMARIMSEEGERLWLKGVFLDGCRWSRGPCPATELERIFVNKDCKVFPCPSGLPIGMLRDGIERLRKNAKEIFKQTRIDRKCETCPADSWCPKCPFVDPLSSQEYCKLQRCEASGIVIRSHIATTIAGSDLEDL